ncbi:1969_t:CDS:2, partial [Gigaspora margarita]
EQCKSMKNHQIMTQSQRRITRKQYKVDKDHQETMALSSLKERLKQEKSPETTIKKAPKNKKQKDSPENDTNLMKNLQKMTQTY